MYWRICFIWPPLPVLGYYRARPNDLENSELGEGDGDIEVLD